MPAQNKGTADNNEERNGRLYDCFPAETREKIGSVIHAFEHILTRRMNPDYHQSGQNTEDIYSTISPFCCHKYLIIGTNIRGLLFIFANNP